MSTTISPPVRILGLVGILLAAAFGVLLFTQSRSNSTSPSASAPATAKRHAGAQRATTPPLHAARPSKAAAQVVLLPGLPAPVSHALRFSKVVVVSLYAEGAPGDGAALGQAQSGASSVHAGFAAVNVLDERNALRLDRFAGTTSSPTVLIVRRPGKIVNRFVGYADSELVAQAAADAGAGR